MVPSAGRHGACGRVLADLAIGRMRTCGKLAELSQAVTGRFTDHHAVLARLRLDRIALFGTAVAGLGAKIAVRVSPYQRELDLLRLVPGFGDAAGCAWLAEIGPAPHEYFAAMKISRPGSRCARQPQERRETQAGPDR